MGDNAYRLWGRGVSESNCVKISLTAKSGTAGAGGCPRPCAIWTGLIPMGQLGLRQLSLPEDRPLRKRSSRSKRARQPRVRRSLPRGAGSRPGAGPSPGPELGALPIEELRGSLVQTAQQLVENEVIRRVGEPWPRKDSSALGRGGSCRPGSSWTGSRSIWLAPGSRKGEDACLRNSFAPRLVEGALRQPRHDADSGPSGPRRPARFEAC